MLILKHTLVVIEKREESLVMIHIQFVDVHIYKYVRCNDYVSYLDLN